MKNTGPTAKTLALVKARNDGACLRCNVRAGEQCHHRRPRKMGGSRRPEINSPENLVWICGHCHAAIESNREAAIATGWLVPEGLDGPLETPLVDLLGREFFLTEEGDVKFINPLVGFYPVNPADHVRPW